MSDLIEFLEARIGEDEVAARAAMLSNGYWHRTGAFPRATSVVQEFGPVVVPERIGSLAWDENAHIARHDPARVLTECTAKRELLQLARHIKDNAWQDGELKAVSEFRADQILRALFLPYTSHPDYDPAWRD